MYPQQSSYGMLLYPTILGQTEKYVQPTYIAHEPEKFVTDNIIATNTYPFNLNSNEIHNIEFKLDSTNICISDNHLSTNKPIFVECVGDTLRVWNIISRPNNTMSTKGNIIIDGYNVLDFNNNNIKVMDQYNYTQWTLQKLNSVKKIIFNGSSNNMDFNVNTTELNMYIFGENKVKVGTCHYDELHIFTTYSEINFLAGSCNNLVLKIEGNGNVKNLTVKKYADITNVGNSIIFLDKLQDTACMESTYGTGAIVWSNV